MTGNRTLPCPKIVRGQERLSEEQIAYAKQFEQERIAAMFATTPIDEELVETSVRATYRVVGLEPPTVRWFDSPITFMQAHLRGEGVSIGKLSPIYSFTWSWTELERHAKESVRQSVEESLFHDVGDHLSFELWDQMRDCIGVIRPSVEDVSGGQIVERAIGDALRESVQDSVWRNCYGYPGDCVQAYSDCTDFTEYHFLHEIFEENDLIHHARLNELVSGYILGSKEAWVIHKPVRLERDEENHLHSADGMCLQYRDGWGFYAWHGIQVPEKLILHPEELTKEEWLGESNLEVRRVMQERWDKERFVEMVGGICIDHGARGDLIAVDLPDDPEGVAHYVHVRDASTERQYYLRVPSSIRRADEAVAWTFGLSVQDYQLAQES